MSKAYEWVKVEVGTVLPPRGEKVLMYFDKVRELQYRAFAYSVDQWGDNRVSPACSHFARVQPPVDLEKQG